MPALESSVPNIFYLYTAESKKNFSIEKITDDEGKVDTLRFAFHVGFLLVFFLRCHF